MTDLLTQSQGLLREGFSLLTMGLLTRHPDRLPDTLGVYAILVADGRQVLERTGYDAQVCGEPWTVERFVHLYTGETFALRTRITEHLQGTMTGSNFRHSLLALEHAYSALSGEEAGRSPCEDWLTAWLCGRALIAFKTCDYVLDVEKDLLSRTASPLNIRDRPKTPYSSKLSDTRRQFKRSFPELFVRR